MSDKGKDSKMKSVVRTARERGLYAVTAYVEPASGRLVIELHSGVHFSVPVNLIESIRHGSGSQLQEIKISPSGIGIHFPQLDADLLVTGLLEGVFTSLEQRKLRWESNPPKSNDTV